MAGSMPPAPGCNFMPPPAAPCPHSKPSDAQAESGADAGRPCARAVSHMAVPPAEDVTGPQAESGADKPLTFSSRQAEPPGLCPSAGGHDLT